MESFLQPNEQVVARSKGDQVVLTSLRIRYSDNGRQLKSIMLDQVCGVRMIKDHQPWLIALAIVSFIISAIFIVEPDPVYAIIPVIASVVCLLLYYTTRRHIVTIASSAMTIAFQTTGMSTVEVLNFLNQIEESRHNFLKSAQPVEHWIKLS